MRNRLRRLPMAIALALSTACSGGGSSPAPSSSSPGATSGLTKLTFFVPAAKKKNANATTGGRHRDYISPDTVSLIITVDQVTNGGTPVLYSTTAYDLTGITVQPSTGVTPDCTELTATPTFKCQIYLNAPPTDSSHTDLFYIYAYNAAQSSNANGGIGGAIPANFVPNGFVLAEDLGPNGGTGGDPVPSSSNPNGIAVNANSQLTFNLYPVVEQPLISVQGQSGSGLILSAPGSGGYSNAMNVSGFDESGNQIDTTLSGTGDGYFINKPTVTTSDTTRFGALPTSVATVSQGVQIQYAPQTGDQPSSDTSTPLSGTATVQTVLRNGGYGGLVDFPIETQSAEVSPLFVYQTTPVYSATDETETLDVFALVHDLPTGVISPDSYVIEYYTTCGDHNIPAFANRVTYAGTGQYVRAEYEIIIDTTLPITTPCTMLFSDGLIGTTFTIPVLSL